jgi:hypothetical protein
MVMAGGLLLISVGYAAGRSNWQGGHSWGLALFWAGQAVMFCPLIVRVLARRSPGEREAAVLAAALAIATYLVKVCYSPTAFSFPDELEHWRTLQNLLATGHLFGVNYALPVSPAYPGLEIVTSALTLLGRVPVFAASLLVVGVAHLVTTVTLYALFRMISGQPRLALAAVTVYAMNPHYQVFDSIFGYQTLALAFYALALLTWRAARTAAHGKTSRAVIVRYWVLAAVFAAATVVTHHITSYLLVGTAAMITAAGLVRRLNLAAVAAIVPAAAFSAGCAALVGLWAWRVAPITVSYLAPAASELSTGIGAALTGSVTRSAGSAAATAPLADRAGSYAVVLLIMVGLPFGWRQIWRTQRGDPWALALGAGSAAYYVAAALPLITTSGSELAGRLLTFVYIPVGYTLATVVVAHTATALRRAVAGFAAVVLLAGGLAIGWPPWWERLPGRYAVDGFESGVTPEGIAAARWAGNWLGANSRIAADFTNNLLMGGYGGLSPVNGVSELFCGPKWTLVDAAIARHLAVVYLLVDQRTTTERSPTGTYFQDQYRGCLVPLEAASLAKFDSVTGVHRIYDSGNIIIYQLTAAAYGQ